MKVGDSTCMTLVLFAKKSFLIEKRKPEKVASSKEKVLPDRVFFFTNLPILYTLLYSVFYLTGNFTTNCSDVDSKDTIPIIFPRDNNFSIFIDDLRSHFLLH